MCLTVPLQVEDIHQHRKPQFNHLKIEPSPPLTIFFLTREVYLKTETENICSSEHMLNNEGEQVEQYMSCNSSLKYIGNRW